MKASPAVPGGYQVSMAVARVTFFEILRERVLYNIVVVSALVLIASVLAAQISNAMTGRVLSDLGWGALLLSCFAVALSQGASCIAREVERRTILVALAKPIHRQQWLLGKYLGVVAVVTLNALLLSLVTLGVSFQMLGEDFWFVPLGTRVGACFLLLVQSWLIAGLAIFFSSFSTATLSAVLSVGIYFVGSSASQIRWLGLQSDGLAVRWFFELVSWLVPNFEFFQVSRQLTYGLPLELGMIAGRSIYGFIWCALLVLLGGMLLQKREL